MPQLLSARGVLVDRLELAAEKVWFIGDVIVFPCHVAMCIVVNLHMEEILHGRLLGGVEESVGRDRRIYFERPRGVDSSPLIPHTSAPHLELHGSLSETSQDGGEVCGWRSGAFRQSDEDLLLVPNMRELIKEYVEVVTKANSEELAPMFPGGSIPEIATLVWAMQESGSADPEQQLHWSAYRPKCTVSEISAPGSSSRPIVVDPESPQEEDIVMIKGKQAMAPLLGDATMPIDLESWEMNPLISDVKVEKEAMVAESSSARMKRKAPGVVRRSLWVVPE